MGRFLFLFLLVISSCQKGNSLKHVSKDSTWTWHTKDGSFQTRYLEEGAGKNHVIFLHGFAASSYSWRNQIKQLAQQGYYVWSIDLIGHGLSEKPLKIPYTIDFYKNQVLDFANEHQIEEFHLVGHSTGASIGLKLALEDEDKLKSLTLINPAAYPIELPPAILRAKKLGKLAEPFITRSSIHEFLKLLYFDPNKISDEQVDRYFEPFLSPGGKRACFKALDAFDQETLEYQSNFYERIRTPTLLIRGQNDQWIPSSHWDQIRNQIPSAELKTIQNCGHCPQEEQPELVNKALSLFLKNR
jgi:pimeloyl-ACP methyl ester carboxylesterase